MLDLDELAEVSAAIGVSEDQVRRDHLISHVLVALADLAPDVLFVGGTALARTHLADPSRGGRLSEDIDLWTPDRAGTAAVLDDRLPRALRREFPGSTWDPPLRSVRDVEPGQLLTSDGLRVRIQLIDNHEWARWPSEKQPIATRYSDVPTGLELKVPTLAAAAAMKTAARMDRHAARDLYDLAQLAELGALTAEAAELLREVTGIPVVPYEFTSMPQVDWEAQLAHQTHTLPPPETCLRQVREAYGSALGWPPR